MSELAHLNVARVLKDHGLWASKGLGQNFLDDPAILEQIAAAAEIEKADVVLEVGPGLGTLTQQLAVRAGQVVAVEVDRRLVSVLRKSLKPYPNVRLIQGDILTLSPPDLELPEGYVVAANIPYNITSALIQHLLTSEPKPKRVVLTVQQEVAARICSRPPNMSLLSLSVQVFGAPAIVTRIPASAFFPVPKVDSAVVRIDVYPSPLIAPSRLLLFFDLARAGFSQKRKMLRNSLSAGSRIPPADVAARLERAGIEPQRRAQTLSLTEWDKLIQVWAAAST